MRGGLAKKQHLWRKCEKRWRKKNILSQEGEMCIMFYVLGVSLLNLWTHIHSVQKHSESQPLPLVMAQP